MSVTLRCREAWQNGASSQRELMAFRGGSVAGSESNLPSRNAEGGGCGPCGLRASELVDLRWEQTDLGQAIQS
jgi:hypothetical protein